MREEPTSEWGIVKTLSQIIQDGGADVAWHCMGLGRSTHKIDVAGGDEDSFTGWKS